MKKLSVICAILMCLFAGCSSEKTASPPLANPSSLEQEEVSQDKDEPESSFPGTYTKPDGWVKAEEYSTEEKIFYIQEGCEGEEKPDNISINIGSNRYSAEDHMSFREAIVKQLLAQLEGIKAQLTGTGTYTHQGYPVYIFTIDEEETGIVTKQYYIVGDYQYCLIHLTNFSGSENVEQAAQVMADSFLWD